MNKEELKEKVKTLPMSSGVYIMKNCDHEIIYVGKAKALRNRVKQYFDESEKTIKVRTMVSHIFEFDYILTESEMDAFLLEDNLIKKYKPKYNILLKDDKRYPYIKINTQEKYPEIVLSRRVLNDKCLYFGPYTGGISVGVMIDIIRSLFKLRTCKMNFNNNKKRERMCLHGDIGNCLAPCVNNVSEFDYNQNVDQAIEFLKGKTQNVIKLLTDKMNSLAENEDFEKAIIVRDQLEMIKKLGEKSFSTLEKLVDFDVFALVCTDSICVVNVMIVREGKNLGQSNYIVDNASCSVEEDLSAFIQNYYINASLLPKTILVNIELSESLQEFLSSKFEKKTQICYSKIGYKRKIVEISEKNAKEYIERSENLIDRKKKMTVDALRQLEQILDLPFVSRIEGYDISNIQGNFNVSSMVVFENGESCKKEYRKFKIKTFEGANDFAAMNETLTRRIEKYLSKDPAFKNKPDLILIDGGLGQLHSANSAIESLGVSFPIISLAKREEEIYTLNSSEPIVLDKSSQALRLLQRVRDESHRFALGYHRTLRNSELMSKFENIEGVGAETRKKLLIHFKTLDNLYNATLDEIASLKGINKNVAIKIYEFIHK